MGVRTVNGTGLIEAVQAIVTRAGTRGTLTLSTVDIAELRELLAASPVPCAEPDLSRLLKTRHGGNVSSGTPFYLFPWQGEPEYDQGHWAVVWYDDLYDLALRATPPPAEGEKYRESRSPDGDGPAAISSASETDGPIGPSPLASRRTDARSATEARSTAGSEPADSHQPESAPPAEGARDEQATTEDVGGRTRRGVEKSSPDETRGEGPSGSAGQPLPARNVETDAVAVSPPFDDWASHILDGYESKSPSQIEWEIVEALKKAWRLRADAPPLAVSRDPHRLLVEEILQRIEGSLRGSIGSIGNTYLPQIGVDEVQRWRARLRGEAAVRQEE